MHALFHCTFLLWCACFLALNFRGLCSIEGLYVNQVNLSFSKFHCSNFQTYLMTMLMMKSPSSSFLLLLSSLVLLDSSVMFTISTRSNPGSGALQGGSHRHIIIIIIIINVVVLLTWIPWFMLSVIRKISFPELFHNFLGNKFGSNFWNFTKKHR